ncbi:MAG: hypothetical protein U0871_04680 [Gemmataceae bacterium]
MTRTCLVALLIGGLGGSSTDDEVTDKTPGERRILAPIDGAERAVEQFDVVRVKGPNRPGKAIRVAVGDLIRIPVSVPSGEYDQFRAKASGAAVFKAVSDVRTVEDGRKSSGSADKEFDLVVTAPGTITVDIEVRSSQPGAAPIKMTIELTAK